MDENLNSSNNNLNPEDNAADPLMQLNPDQSESSQIQTESESFPVIVPPKQEAIPQNNVYRWNINDERNFNAPNNFNSWTKPQKPKKNIGLRVFAAVMCVMFILAAVPATYFTVGNIQKYINGVVDDDAKKQYDAPVISNKDAVNDTAAEAAAAEKELESTAAVIEPDNSPSKILSTEEAIAKAKPSVVCIETETEYEGYSRYFGGRNTTPYVEQGVGTGFIIHKDGYIATNYHVVNGAGKIKVTLLSGETYSANVIGGDETADLAIIKINAENLTAAELGDSDALVQGQDVVAIGTPAGMEFGWTVTKGIVSAIGRVVTVNDSSSSYSRIGREMEVIQTDASINPGNSGGPLINMRGQVIGINSMKLASSDYEGMGFSIPINIAIPVFNEIIANPNVIKTAPESNDSVADDGYSIKDKSNVSFGIKGGTVSDSMIANYNVPQGYCIDSVTEGGACYNSGISPGDIIVALDGEDVFGEDDLLELKLKYKPGDKVTITVYRNGRIFDFEVTLAAR